jgi:hypothetical protein
MGQIPVRPGANRAGLGEIAPKGEKSGTPREKSGKFFS